MICEQQQRLGRICHDEDCGKRFVPVGKYQHFYEDCQYKRNHQNKQHIRWKN